MPRTASTARRSQREHLPQLPFFRRVNFQNDQTACASVKHNRKSSHYFILWPVSAPPGSPSHQHHQPIKPFSWRSICRRLLLGTWNNRTLVWDLAPPHFPFPPSEQPNRLAKNCDNLGGSERRRSNPSLLCSILPPARPCAGPSSRISQLNIDRQQGASWYRRSEHLDCSPHSFSWFTISQLSQLPLSAIYFSLSS